MNHMYWTYVQQFSDFVKGGAHDFVNREISQQPSHRWASWNLWGPLRGCGFDITKILWRSAVSRCGSVRIEIRIVRHQFSRHPTVPWWKWQVQSSIGTTKETLGVVLKLTLFFCPQDECVWKWGIPPNGYLNGKSGDHPWKIVGCPIFGQTQISPLSYGSPVPCSFTVHEPPVHGLESHHSKNQRHNMKKCRNLRCWWLLMAFVSWFGWLWNPKIIDWIPSIMGEDTLKHFSTRWMRQRIRDAMARNFDIDTSLVASPS